MKKYFLLFLLIVFLIGCNNPIEPPIILFNEEGVNMKEKNIILIVGGSIGSQYMNDLIINNYQEIFVELGGCFGFFVNRFDNEVIQNPHTIDVYKRFRLTDSDFPGINDIPIVSRNSKLPYPTYQIDSSYLPGHRETYGDLVFTTAPYMWFGPDYIRFFSQEKLKKYNNCQKKDKPFWEKVFFCTEEIIPLY